jgi:hypothetical protein
MLSISCGAVPYLPAGTLHTAFYVICTLLTFVLAFHFHLPILHEPTL